MKRVINILALCIICTTAFAQNPPKDKEGWRDRMNAEMIAFYSSEVDLTAEEAEQFWPVFNEARDAQHKAFKAVREAYEALEKAVGDGKGDITALTDDYLAAQAESNSVMLSYLPRFRAILPAEKVAKVYLADEKFRRQQIHSLRPGGKDGSQQPGGQGRPPRGEGRSRK